MQLRCPVCQATLKPREVNGCNVWSCPAGDGMGITVPLVRAALEPETFKSFWLHVARDDGPAGRKCPGCEQPMHEVPAEGTNSPILLDVCKRCQLIWFDPAELEALPAKPKKRPIPTEARQLLAMESVRLMGEEARLKDAAERARQRAIGSGHGGGWLDFLFGLIGS